MRAVVSVVCVGVVPVDSVDEVVNLVCVLQTAWDGATSTGGVATESCNGWCAECESSTGWDEVPAAAQGGTARSAGQCAEAVARWDDSRCSW